MTSHCSQCGFCHTYSHSRAGTCVPVKAHHVGDELCVCDNWFSVCGHHEFLSAYATTTSASCSLSASKNARMIGLAGLTIDTMKTHKPVCLDRARSSSVHVSRDGSVFHGTRCV